MNIFRQFEAARPFTRNEAWMLFRVGAYTEAVGWALLITGIILKYYVFHGNDVPVAIAGRFHGIFFGLYFLAALGLYPSLGWSRWRVVIAAMASVPPFGSLIFEQGVVYLDRRAMRQRAARDN